ncbi:MAG TPA: cupin domain-containing protein [Ktedonobacterales bacterium]|nr:cupin domain-containing protein [Ktedonobacterales bacterium]
MRRQLDVSTHGRTGSDEWRTIVEPKTGARLTFETSGVETGGAFVRARGFLPAHAPGPPRHRHRTCSESFTVLSGQLTLNVAGRLIRLGPGENATVPPGIAHTFRNEGDVAVEATSEVCPAVHFEDHLRALYGLMRAGRMDPINFALAMRLGESLPAGPPVPVARALVGILAWVGDRMGRDGSFPEFTRPPSASDANK